MPMTAHQQHNRDDSTGNTNSRSGEKHSGLLEKIFTVLSLLLIIAMVGYLVKETVASHPPAAFEVEQAAPIKRGQFTAVDVFVRNTGDEAAKAVNITGEVAGPDGKPIEAEATMDWLPGKSRRKVTLLFPHDIGTTEPEVEVIGYEEP